MMSPTASAGAIDRRWMVETGALVLLPLAAATYYLALELAALETGLGMPLDDAFIHLVFARSLSQGLGFSYESGTLVAGSTGPLWTALLSAISLLPGGVLVWTKLLGVGLHVGSSLLTRSVARIWGSGDGAAFFAGLAVGLTSWLMWSALSGMEVALFVFLTLAGVRAHLRELRADPGRPAWSLLLLASSALARPEGLLLLGLALVERLLQLASLSRVGRRRALAPLGWGLGSALLVLAPAALLAWASHASVLPTTYIAKVDSGHKWLPAIRDLWRQGQVLFVAQPWLTLLAGAGAVQALVSRLTDARSSLLPVCWLVALPCAYSMMTPAGSEVLMGNFGRYLFPLLPFVVLVGARGLEPLASGVALGRGRIVGIVLGAALLLSAPTLGLLRGARFYALSVANVEQSDVAAARWIAANLPPDAILGVQDVGALAYLTSNPIVDLVGLVDTRVLQVLHVAGDARGAEAFDRLMDHVRERRVDALVLFPESYGWQRLQSALPGLRVVYSHRLERNITMAGSEIVVALTPWSRLLPPADPPLEDP